MVGRGIFRVIRRSCWLRDQEGIGWGMAIFLLDGAPYWFGQFCEGVEKRGVLFISDVFRVYCV